MERLYGCAFWKTYGTSVICPQSQISKGTHSTDDSRYFTILIVRLRRARLIVARNGLAAIIKWCVNNGRLAATET